MVHPGESSLQPITEERLAQLVKTAILESKFTSPQVLATKLPDDGATKRTQVALKITSELITETSQRPVSGIETPETVLIGVLPKPPFNGVAQL